MVRAINFSFFLVSINILNFVTFSVYTGTGNALNARKVFTFLALVSFARLYFAHILVYFLLTLQEMRVAVQRIQVNIATCHCRTCSLLVFFTETTITTRTW